MTFSPYRPALPSLSWVNNEMKSTQAFGQNKKHSYESIFSVKVQCAFSTRSCSCPAGWEPALWCRHRCRSGGESRLAVTGSWKWPTARWERITCLVQTWFIRLISVVSLKYKTKSTNTLLSEVCYRTSWSSVKPRFLHFWLMSVYQ